MATEMSKAELLAEAKELGADVDENNSIPQIEAAINRIKADDAEDAEATERDRQSALAAASGRSAGQAQATAPATVQESGNGQLTDSDPEIEPKGAPVAEVSVDKPVDPAAAKPAYVTGSTGSTYEIAGNETAPEAEEVAAVEAVTEDLKDMPRSLLQRLKSAIDGALLTKGVEPTRAGPVLSEIVATFPVNDEATAGLTPASVMSSAKRAEVDIKEDQILDFVVRQQRGAGGFTGPEYLRVVTSDGKKHTIAA
jgi:hypothetical protein